MSDAFSFSKDGDRFLRLTRIPTRDSRETRRAAALVAADLDVVPRLLELGRVNGRVDEADRGLTSRETSVVDHRQHGADDRSRSRSSVNEAVVAVDGDNVVGAI